MTASVAVRPVARLPQQSEPQVLHHLRARSRRRWVFATPYGWPFTALFAGFPLWWALGFGGLAVPVFAVPMAMQLWRTPGTKLPRGLGIWIVFLLVVLLSFATLGVNPAGTIAEGASGRIMPFAFRLAFYLSATTILVYVVNLDRRRYSQLKVARTLGWGFVWVALGGYLGLLAPKFEFTAPLELLIPRGILANAFVRSLVHPTAAQVQDFLGYDAPRPSAPFGYTNVWGHAFALLLPWFVVAFVVLARGRRRTLGAAFAVASLVPAIGSLNRGLWVGLVVAVAYVVVRQVLRGRMVLAVASSTGVALLVLLLVVTPLGGLLQQRLDNGHSNNVRSYSVQQAIELAQASPVIGLGNTRNALGSPQSIAVGRSASCPLCGNVPIGTNGHLWFELMAHGVLGAGLYVATLLLVTWRYRRLTSPIALAAHLNLVLMLWFMFVYGVLPVPLAIAFAAWAVLWREQHVAPR